MYICLCKGITDRQIKQAVDNGAQNLAHVREDLGVGSQCGKCAKITRQIIKTQKQQNSGQSLFYAVGAA